jgi:hypothetical protein
LHTSNRRELFVTKSLVRGDVGGGDSRGIVGVAEEPFCVSYLVDVRHAVFEFRDGRPSSRSIVT